MKNKSVYSHLRNAVLVSTGAMILGMGYASVSVAEDVKTNYTGWDADAMFMWKGKGQTRFEEGQRTKAKFMFKLGFVEDETDEGEINNDFFEIKNARINLLGKLSDRTYARLIVGYDPLLNRYGPAFEDDNSGKAVRQAETNLASVWIQHNIK